MPSAFSHHFYQKICKIRNSLDQSNIQITGHKKYNGKTFSTFQPVSEEIVRKTIMSMPTKSCNLDPLSTDYVKHCLDELLPHITSIVNASLSTATVPVLFKNALVIPLLKKNGLDPNLLNNYRPVSNLPFISKVLERIVLNQLQQHLISNGLQDLYQSAYKSGHSTETAVVNLVNNLLLKSDSKQASIVFFFVFFLNE